MRNPHLMIDLETLGTVVNAPIVAIGAVYFDPDTGEQFETFDAAIDVADAMRYGRASGDTIKWWLTQGDAARQKVARGTDPALKVFEAFHKFCLKHGNDVKPWGNGATFDISMLDYSFQRILDKPAPWKFWNVRDCRTIKELADGIVTFNESMTGTAALSRSQLHLEGSAPPMHKARWKSCPSSSPTSKSTSSSSSSE